MLSAMDLIWGEGFMAPGGIGNVEQMVRGLDLHDRDVLDIGCGQGEPACILAREHGARVVGTDLEAHLVERARKRAAEADLDRRVSFCLAKPGPLDFVDESFDCIVCSGAMTQIEDKLSMLCECLRVLRPGGTLSCYDWMKPPGPLSKDMHYWFELEGLTYALRTPDEHLDLLRDAGFSRISQRDKSAWYRKEAAREYERLRGAWRGRLEAILGAEETAHFIEDWRMLVRLCENGELLQVYTQAVKEG
ncbi:MAG: methyltransferase domain-containing protein [Pseudomonadota bacterium]